MSAAPERALAWATLAQKHLDAPTLAALLRAIPDPAALLTASRAQLLRIAPEKAIARLTAPLPEAREARTRAWLADPAHEVIAWDDPDYPRALLAVGDAPPALFFVGRRELLNRPAIAIVGSRNATPGGLDNARAFAQALSDAGLCVVSGLAAGIDGAAHEGGLEGAGGTLAVCGTGLDRVYPARHRALAHRIAEHGALLSEYPPGTPPAKENFPRRNRPDQRLVQRRARRGSDAVIGLPHHREARGGAGARGVRDPRIDSFAFLKGCHKLIREGAKLVETAQDVLMELQIGAAGPTARARGRERAARCRRAAAIGHEPGRCRRLIARTASARAVAAALVTSSSTARRRICRAALATHGGTPPASRQAPRRAVGNSARRAWQVGIRTFFLPGRSYVR
jgi:DNA processing protein